MKETEFLTLAEVTEIHADQIKRYGGKGGTRDINLLSSAVAMPYASFSGYFLHKDIYEMAAAYAFHICRNHPFIDGNKRTALSAALVFLEMNGIGVLDPEGKLYEATMDIASGKIKKEELTNVFKDIETAKEYLGKAAGIPGISMP
jgi:death-on-curing protein